MSSLTWVELDAAAPEHNLAELRKGAAPGVLFCAVIKSNAYGHGVAEMRSLLPSADWFGVNSLEEGLELRALGEKRPIVLLGTCPALPAFGGDSGGPGPHGLQQGNHRRDCGAPALRSTGKASREDRDRDLAAGRHALRSGGFPGRGVVPCRTSCWKACPRTSPTSRTR